MRFAERGCATAAAAFMNYRLLYENATASGASESGTQRLQFRQLAALPRRNLSLP
jgi:hypothetical protein